MQNKPDTDAFLADLYALRQIGMFRTGVHRPRLSELKTRGVAFRSLIEQMDTTMDGIGNVLGRHPGDAMRRFA